jgi:hypothetical protein
LGIAWQPALLAWQPLPLCEFDDVQAARRSKSAIENS